jgi:hypothetical protein
MSFGNFLAVCVGLILWVISLYCFIPGFMRLIEIFKPQQDESLFAAGRRFFATRSERWQVAQQRHHEQGELVEAALFLLAGIVLFFIGMAVMNAVIPLWKVLSLVLGILCLAGCVWLWRHYGARRSGWRRQRQAWATATPPRVGPDPMRGHRNEVLAHIIGVLLLPVIGVLLIVSIF